MPSRDEIAEWLREAAATERAIAAACATGSLPLRFMQESIDKAILFEQRASQVDAMRCVECKKSKGPSVDAVTFCNKFFVNAKHDHGCFAHEQKETKDAK